MALILNFELCQSSDCSAITFVETTGVYNDVTNPTGWGAPNATIASATSAILTVLLGSGTAYNLDLLTLSAFPKSDNTFEYILPNESFGGTTDSPIDDQIINFTYTVIAGGITYTQNIQQAFYCQAQCCVMSMFADIDSDCDSCFKDQMYKALSAYTLLKGLIYNANCGNKTAFNNILAQINKLCLNSNCTNCK